MAVKYPQMIDGRYIGGLSSWEQCQMILNTRGLDIVPNLKQMVCDFPVELVQEAIDRKISIRSILKERGEDVTPYIGALRNYQTTGVAFMYLSPRSIIADGCGLGKTAEIAGLINWLKYKGEMTRFLLACENSAIGQLTYELIRFTGLNIIALPSTTEKLRKEIERTDWNRVDGIVIKHSALRNDYLYKWMALNLDENKKCKIFNTFLLDESSVIKKPDTKIYNYTKNICEIVTRVHFMNATVFENNLFEVYTQVDMMNSELLPKKWRIEKEYCNHSSSTYWTKQKDDNGVMKSVMHTRHAVSGYKNQEKFKKALELVYFGRSRKDIGIDLPHVYKVYEVLPTTAMNTAIGKGHRYNEVLNCPALLHDVPIEMTRKDIPKLDRLCELVENEFAEDSVMIYCFHLEAQKAIAEEMEKLGRKPVILNGQCDDEEKRTAQDGFNNGVYDTIITNIKKSLNLYGGDVCIFYSMESNPSKSFQIASRIDRNVDDSIKTFVLLIYKDSPEYELFTHTVKQRAKDARDLTIDAKTTVDFFIEAMEQEQNTEGNN